MFRCTYCGVRSEQCQLHKWWPRWTTRILTWRMTPRPRPPRGCWNLTRLKTATATANKVGNCIAKRYWEKHFHALKGFMFCSEDGRKEFRSLGEKKEIRLSSAQGFYFNYTHRRAGGLSNLILFVLHSLEIPKYFR